MFFDRFFWQIFWQIFGQIFGQIFSRFFDWLLDRFLDTFFDGFFDKVLTYSYFFLCFGNIEQNFWPILKITWPATNKTYLRIFLEPLSVSTDSFHLSHEWILLINDLDLDPRMMKSKLLGARSNRKLELAHTELIHTGSFCLKMSRFKKS